MLVELVNWLLATSYQLESARVSRQAGHRLRLGRARVVLALGLAADHCGYPSVKERELSSHAAIRALICLFVLSTHVIAE